MDDFKDRKYDHQNIQRLYSDLSKLNSKAITLDDDASGMFAHYFF